MADVRRAVLVLLLCVSLMAGGVPASAGTPGVASTRAAEKSGQLAGGEGSPPPATVGAKAPEAATPPAKAVDEPVFQLPELVIIGENRARIMAQKEALSGSPLQGLHEAPLLEKEESTVTALRRREPALIVRPSRTGTGVAVRLEAGTKSWMAGGLWAGRQTDHSTIGLDLDGSTLGGEAAGAGHAGGFATGAAVSGGWTGATPKWLSWLSLGADPDLVNAAAGWREQWRDLPWNTADPQAARRLTRVWASGDESRAATGWSVEQRLEIVHLRTPVRSAGAAGVSAGGSMHLWGNDTVAVRLNGRGEGELADATGDHMLVGALAEAAWIPARRWRGQVGLRTEGVFGGRVFAGSAGPVGGIAWTSPYGPELAASFYPSLSAPWLSREAVASPYSVFGRRLVPVRGLADFELVARQEWWRGDEARVAFRMTRTRDALSWAEVPGTGLFAPAAVPDLRVCELAVSGRLALYRPLVASAAVRARSVATRGGSMANLPRSDGTVGAEYSWKTLTGGVSLEVLGSRPRSFSGGSLDSFASFGAFLAWKPATRFEVRLRGGNLNGATVERWAGYPEPRRFVAISALAAF